MQLSTNSQSEMTPGGATPGPEQRQRKRLILALVCLLSAIGVVAVKNRAYLMPAEPTSAEYSASAPLPETQTPGGTSSSTTPSSVGDVSPKARSSKSKTHRKPEVPTSRQEAEAFTPSVSRRALPPLDVEVYAGGRSIPLQPKTPNSVRVDTSNGTEGRAASSASSVDASGRAGEHVRISPEALQVLAHPVDPNYPLLAREMKVQGAVVLDALIGRDGTIQNLKIVSGPTILANAAMEAVRQWRFKPYYQAGEAVETAARITVNFTISTT